VEGNGHVSFTEARRAAVPDDTDWWRVDIQADDEVQNFAQPLAALALHLAAHQGAELEARWPGHVRVRLTLAAVLPGLVGF